MRTFHLFEHGEHVGVPIRGHGVVEDAHDTVAVGFCTRRHPHRDSGKALQRVHRVGRERGGAECRDEGREVLQVPQSIRPQPTLDRIGRERRDDGRDDLLLFVLAARVRQMHRLIVLYPPPADPDRFRTYYEETHIKLVAKLPGLRSYRYGFDVAADAGESPYFCVFEADFDDAAAMSAARQSAEGQAVSADVPNYATGGVVVLNSELRAG